MSYVADVLGPEGFGTYSVDWSQWPPVFERVSRPPDVLLVPGFVDIHIHGAFGIDVMNDGPAALSILCRKLQAQGYDGFLPTTVSCVAQTALDVLNKLPDDPLILGLHLEGPFINLKFKGAQPESAIQDPPVDDPLWDAVLDHPMLRLVTLAPEQPNALDLMLKLQRRGVHTSMGHSNATYDEARRGFEFGAELTTHTFNAMRALHHREAGIVGYALTNDALRTELIYDRHHVCKETAALLMKCKPADGIVAVSDGTVASGMPKGQRITLFGQECITGAGDVRIESTGTLAGSAITLLEAFRNLAEDFGPEPAIRACSINPRLALRIAKDPGVWLEFDRRYELIGRRCPPSKA